VGRELASKFSLNLPDFNVAFRDLLHILNLRHGTHSFTSFLKERVLRIFLRPEKSDGFGRVRTRELGFYRLARYI
jgi:hypothetical protein